MVNRPSIILKKLFFDLIPHKFGKRAKLLPNVSTAYKMLVIQTKENPSISFNYVRVTSVTDIPTSPNFLFRKIIKSISFMEMKLRKQKKCRN